MSIYVQGMVEMRRFLSDQLVETGSLSHGFGSQSTPEFLPRAMNNTVSSAVLYEAQCSYKIKVA